MMATRPKSRIRLTAAPCMICGTKLMASKDRRPVFNMTLEYLNIYNEIMPPNASTCNCSNCESLPLNYSDFDSKTKSYSKKQYICTSHYVNFQMIDQMRNEITELMASMKASCHELHTQTEEPQSDINMAAEDAAQRLNNIQPITNTKRFKTAGDSAQGSSKVVLQPTRVLYVKQEDPTTDNLGNIRGECTKQTDQTANSSINIGDNSTHGQLADGTRVIMIKPDLDWVKNTNTIVKETDLKGKMDTSSGNESVTEIKEESCSETLSYTTFGVTDIEQVQNTRDSSVSVTNTSDNIIWVADKDRVKDTSDTSSSVTKTVDNNVVGETETEQIGNIVSTSMTQTVPVDSLASKDDSSQPRGLNPMFPSLTATYGVPFEGVISTIPDPGSFYETHVKTEKPWAEFEESDSMPPATNVPGQISNCSGVPLLLSTTSVPIVMTQQSIFSATISGQSGCSGVQQSISTTSLPTVTSEQSSGSQVSQTARKSTYLLAKAGKFTAQLQVNKRQPLPGASQLKPPSQGQSAAPVQVHICLTCLERGEMNVFINKSELKCHMSKHKNDNDKKSMDLENNTDKSMDSDLEKNTDSDLENPLNIKVEPSSDSKHDLGTLKSSLKPGPKGKIVGTMIHIPKLDTKKRKCADEDSISSNVICTSDTQTKNTSKDNYCKKSKNVE